jgi:hypothetical protein
VDVMLLSGIEPERPIHFQNFKNDRSAETLMNSAFQRMMLNDGMKIMDGGIEEK